MFFPKIIAFATLASLVLTMPRANAADEKPVSATIPAPVARKSPAYVIIKADDLRAKGQSVDAAWQKLVDFARERKINIGIGIIADSLETDNPGYFSWIKKQRATGLVEFWNHGYDHKQWKEAGVNYQEFKGTSFKHQKQHLECANDLAREKLGFAFETFGAPFNATDENTAKALAQSPDIKIWLYGDGEAAAGKLVLARTPAANLEAPIFKPNLLKFAQGYNKFPDQELFVIQGHPAQWSAQGWQQFVGIVDFLTEAKAVFVTPTQYRDLKMAEK